MFPKKLGIKDSDLCSIMLNIMDNAVESCEKEDNKTISLSSQSKGNMLLIEMDNSCSKNPIENNFQSVKKGNHGWGLKVVDDIVKEYEGTIEHYFEKNIYSVKILLIQK